MPLARPLATAAFLLIGLAMPASAETIGYIATLAGSNEVPPTPSAGTGQVLIDYDPTTRRLSWSFEQSGLSQPMTMAHFHGPAQAGVNAGVLVPIAGANAPNPVKGEAVLSEELASMLTSGRLYVNVHSTAHPSGEIRGQVVPRP